MKGQLRILSCDVCGFAFQAKRHDALYCSATCRSNARWVREGRITAKHAAKLARNRRAKLSRRRVYGRA